MTQSTTQTLRAAVITISDSTFQGKRRDTSGPAVAELLQKNGWTVVHSRVVADDLAVIAATLRELSAQPLEAIFTTGGTGISTRDVTPEATRKVVTREIPVSPNRCGVTAGSPHPRRRFHARLLESPEPLSLLTCPAALRAPWSRWNPSCAPSLTP